MKCEIEQRGITNPKTPTRACTVGLYCLRCGPKSSDDGTREKPTVQAPMGVPQCSVIAQLLVVSMFLIPWFALSNASAQAAAGR
jgi:hypothetical protein